MLTAAEIKKAVQILNSCFQARVNLISGDVLHGAGGRHAGWRRKLAIQIEKVDKRRDDLLDGIAMSIEVNLNSLSMNSDFIWASPGSRRFGKHQICGVICGVLRTMGVTPTTPVVPARRAVKPGSVRHPA